MRKILLLIIIIKGSSAFGQKVELSDNQVTANILPLTISYERKIDDDKSFTIQGGIAPTAYWETRDNQTESYFFLSPYLSSSIRHYYSRKNVKKTNLKNNSGNFVGIYYQQSFEPFGSASDFNEQRARNEVSNRFILGPVWGIQRNYASGINLSLTLGVGYTNGKYQEKGEVQPIADFTFGFVLFSK